MEKKQIKLGVAATRRHVFSREDAIAHKNKILHTLRDSEIEFIDLEWLNEDGLLFAAESEDAVEERFRQEKVDALFIPHCNFGCEEAVCKLAKRLAVPVLLWGPRDEAPLADGSRLRDSQCGLFATSKVLQRMKVPFTYMENSWIDDGAWLEGVKKFIRVAGVVKSFRNMKIGQIDTRPGDFWSVMCNESELLEKFNIEIVPLTLVDLEVRVKQCIRDNDEELQKTLQIMSSSFQYDFGDEALKKMAALKLVMKNWAAAYSLSAIAIQCWDALQDALGIMPCMVNSMLTEEGLPVVCETDINGAITAVLTQAAGGSEPIFFADVTVRHPENDNAELLWHCGPFPAGLRRTKEKAKLGNHYVLKSGCPGVCEWELKHDRVTIVRFDGIDGGYSLMAAEGKGIEGPYTRGTYLWVEFTDWAKLEEKLIYGPYIHHVAGVYAEILPVLKEALRYMPGVKDDLYTV